MPTEQSVTVPTQAEIEAAQRFVGRYWHQLTNAETATAIALHRIYGLIEKSPDGLIVPADKATH